MSIEAVKINSKLDKVDKKKIASKSIVLIAIDSNPTLPFILDNLKFEISEKFRSFQLLLIVSLWRIMWTIFSFFFRCFGCKFWICRLRSKTKIHGLDRFHGNGPYCKILTEKEPIRAQGFAQDWVCHIINLNIYRNLRELLSSFRLIWSGQSGIDWRVLYRTVDQFCNSVSKENFANILHTSWKGNTRTTIMILNSPLTKSSGWR